MANNAPLKQCQGKDGKCFHDAVKGERFCKDCKKALLEELKESGYLTPLPWNRGRTSDQKEAPTYDPSPAGENAVRALEDG